LNSIHAQNIARKNRVSKNEKRANLTSTRFGCMATKKRRKLNKISQNNLTLHAFTRENISKQKKRKQQTKKEIFA